MCRVDASTRPMLNPIAQVRGYCDYLASFNGALAERPERIAGAAYLHNATDFGIAGLSEIGESERGGCTASSVGAPSSPSSSHGSHP